MVLERHHTPRVGDYVYLPGGDWVYSKEYPYHKTWVVAKQSRTVGRIVSIDRYTKEATIEWFDNKYYPRAIDEAKITHVDYALFFGRWSHDKDGFMLKTDKVF